MKKIDTLEPEFKDIVEKVLADAAIATGLDWIVISGRRTMAEQDALFAQGRTKSGPVVTKAKAGQSSHNFGLAADLCPLKDGNCYWNAPDDIWHIMADIAEHYGLTAGYYWEGFKDMPHIEARNWKAAQQAWKDGKLEVA